MKRALFIAVAAAGLVFAAPALADATGTVGVTGSVAAKCQVIGVDGNNFTGTISLGELAQTDGTLRTDLQGSTPVTGATKTFRVNCTSSDAQITLSADELDAGMGAPGGGRSSTLDYTAEFDGALSPSGTKQITYNTTSASPTVDTLGGPLANAANNITISAYSFITVGGLGDILRSSNNYVGAIHVTITPQ
jgi:hypothetical protein